MTVPESTAHAQDFTIEGLEAFNSQFHKMVDDRKLANIVTLVSRHCQIVNLDAYGVLDMEASPQAPVQTNSIFRIASMTKPITGVAMMLLWEEGKWDLSDHVAKHIPEFEGLEVWAGDGTLVTQATPQTMAQLMSHTAGFGRASDYGQSLDYGTLRSGNLQDMIDLLAKMPLHYQPGKDWRYGPSVDIQGYIIEKLSGQSLDEFFEQRVFRPLGMVDTGFWVDQAKADRVTRIHQWDENGLVIAAKEASPLKTSKPKFLAGGGGLFSTVTDYWRFSQMLLNGGEFEGRRYLKTSTVELMHTSVLEPGVNVTLYSPDTRGLGFGMDFAVVEDSVAAKSNQAVQSFYWGGAFGTWFWIDPLNDMIVIGFIQNIGGTTPDGAPLVREASARAIYAALKDKAKGVTFAV